MLRFELDDIFGEGKFLAKVAVNTFDAEVQPDNDNQKSTSLEKHSEKLQDRLSDYLARTFDQQLHLTSQKVPVWDISSPNGNAVHLVSQELPKKSEELSKEGQEGEEGISNGMIALIVVAILLVIFCSAFLWLARRRQWTCSKTWTYMVSGGQVNQASQPAVSHTPNSSFTPNSSRSLRRHSSTASLPEGGSKGVSHPSKQQTGSSFPSGHLSSGSKPEGGSKAVSHSPKQPTDIGSVTEIPASDGTEWEMLFDKDGVHYMNHSNHRSQW